MKCSFSGCDNPAILRAWFARPCCGHLEAIHPVCDEHPVFAPRPTLCPGCKYASRLKITKRKRIKTNHKKKGNK